MDMQHGHAAWPCDIDRENGHSAWAYGKIMLLAKQNGYAARTSSMEN